MDLDALASKMLNAAFRSLAKHPADDLSFDQLDAIVECGLEVAILSIPAHA